MALPRFRYNPDAISSFQDARATCPRCGVRRELEYIGPQYGLDEIDHLCGFCIADGSAAQTFDLEFTSSDGPEPGPDAGKLEELVFRTPGYLGPEGDRWPVHCDDYCAHVGRVFWRDLSPLLSELEPEISAFCEETTMDLDELEAEVERDRSPLLVHLFRCLACGRHRLVAGYE